MERTDFYNDRRKERKFDFLADYRLVQRYFCAKHDLQRSQYEMLHKLYSLGTFIKKDFDKVEGIYPWSAGRFMKMIPEWVVVYRERKPSKGQDYKIYTVSNKTKKMVEDTYRILCGEMAIPEAPRFNPIMSEDGYADTRYASAIREFNKARANR